MSDGTDSFQILGTIAGPISEESTAPAAIDT